jgi:hypothetical protein
MIGGASRGWRCSRPCASNIAGVGVRLGLDKGLPGVRERVIVLQGSRDLRLDVVKTRTLIPLLAAHDLPLERNRRTNARHDRVNAGLWRSLYELLSTRPCSRTVENRSLGDLRGARSASRFGHLAYTSRQGG